MKIMVRHADDDFHALKIANGMEAAGASVFSITPNGEVHPYGAVSPHLQYTVWAKVTPDDDTIFDIVDEAIEKERLK